MAASTTRTFGGISSLDYLVGDGTNLTNVPLVTTGTIGNVAIFNASSNLSSEALLNQSRGGTGLDMSAMLGVVYVSAGTWGVGTTESALRGGTGADLSASTGIPSISAGTWSTEAILSTAHGGTGLNTSASTGTPTISAGTWSFSSTLPVSKGGTGTNLGTGSGVFYITAGTWSVDTILTSAHGGTGITTVSLTGVPSVSSGTWTLNTNYLPTSYGGTGQDITGSGNTGFFKPSGSSSFTMTNDMSVDFSVNSTVINQTQRFNTTDSASHTWVLKSLGTMKKVAITGIVSATIMQITGTVTNTSEKYYRIFYIPYINSDANATYFHDYKTANLTGEVLTPHVNATDKEFRINYSGISATTLEWSIHVEATLSFDSTA
jgi:hypothetical protein